MNLKNKFIEKNCFFSWFFNKKIIFLLKKIWGFNIKRVIIVSGFDIVIEVSSVHLYSMLYFFNKHTFSQFKILIDIVCYDKIKANYRFTLVYNLLSMKYNSRVRVLLQVNELMSILSVIGLFNSANWLEREVFDFFGIFFSNNLDLRRILTDYGFNGFPLRKDFPLTGYFDIYYDDNQKRICFKNLELNQEYRNFKLRTTYIL